MNLLNARLSLQVVVAALAAALGAGGTMAVAGAKQAEVAGKVEVNQQRLTALEKESQAQRERLLRIEINTGNTKETVERIERKLDGR